MPANTEAIARRAYEIWEKTGREKDRALDHWTQAERELNAYEGEEPLRFDAAPPVSNLDRALDPAERQEQRTARHGGNAGIPGERWELERFVVLADRAHVRIFQLRSPAGLAPHYEAAAALDFPAGRESYTDRDTDQAGRKGAPLRGGPGGSIDERLPMRNEHERRLVTEVVAAIARFLTEHPRAQWDFAAGPGLHEAVLNQLPDEVRRRLERSEQKELTRSTSEELRAHFPPVGRG
jgi:hypothetical protein